MDGPEGEGMPPPGEPTSAEDLFMMFGGPEGSEGPGVLVRVLLLLVGSVGSLVRKVMMVWSTRS